MKLKLWHLIAGLVLVGVLETFNNSFLFQSQLWFPVYDLIELLQNILLLLIVYVLIRNVIRAIKGLLTRRSSSRDEELERQREIERKEIDMVRKSNEILLHLIQDEHKDDR